MPNRFNDANIEMDDDTMHRRECAHIRRKLEPDNVVNSATAKADANPSLSHVV